jgi:aminoglycoside phosphotransferase (APT) family kinase protein
MDPELLQNIGFLVAEIHAINLIGFGPISLQSISSDNPTPQGLHTHWHNYIFLRLEDHIATCEKNKIISTQEASQIYSIFHANKGLFSIMNSVLLHGDLGIHNLISTDGKTISGIIDWEDCMAGDPVFDIAFWGTFFKDGMIEEFLKGYTAVHTLSDDFYTRYWLYYLRIALSKTVHRHIFGYKDIKGRPLASSRISKALSHF